MMNKVFEIIEAKKIFNLNYDQLDILVHPTSYVHAIIKFKDGMIKIVAHDTDMRIPIFNSLHDNQTRVIKTDKINIKNISLSTTLIITNTLGAVLKKFEIQENSSLTLDISDLESGIYFIYGSDSSITFSKKFIKI